MASIIPFLYEGTTVNDIINRYVAALRCYPTNSDNLFHANLLEHYSAVVEDSDFCRSVQKLMSTFYFELEQSYTIAFKGRKKGLISAENKALMQILRQKTDPDYAAELNDSLAFRIIVGSNSPTVVLNSLLEDLTKATYSIMDKCIDFFLKFGFTPLKAEKIFDTTDFDLKNFKEIFVPKKSYLQKENIRFVKDYIMHPKAHGYQSLHILFRDPKGRVFEVQIRTIYMDAHAENGVAAHSTYKSSKTSKYQTVDVSEIEISRIKATSFSLKDNKPYDRAGILNCRDFIGLSNF